MLKKRISYTDFNGMKREEDFYFNLSQAEILEMELVKEGGFRSYINRIVAAQNIPTLTKVFKELILKSYGEKSDDGRRFIKSKELSEAFCQTEAYSNLFMELATDTDKASDFINGIIPADIAEKAKELSDKENLSEEESKVVDMPAATTTNKQS